MSIISDLGERIRGLLFRGRDEQELREELEFHVTMDAEQRQRHTGVDGVEARRRSILALGGIERTREEVRDARGTRLAEDTVSDVGFTLRTLRHNPGFALVAILTLAVGIGGTTAVYSAVDAVLLQPLPYQQPGQLVRIYAGWKAAPQSRSFLTPVHFLAYRDRLASFESIAAILTYDATGADIGTGATVRRIRLLPISADYFDVFKVHPALGRGFERSDETGEGTVADIGPGAHLIVLSNPFWRDRFHADPAIAGKSLVMNGVAYTITGVMPAGFTDPLAGTVEGWIPMDLRPGLLASNAGNEYLSAIGRLRPGVTLARAQAELDLVQAALLRQYPASDGMTGVLEPLKQDVVGSSARPLEIMLGAVALVLLLVCVNIANLLLVRGSDRAREFALRSALGAERGRLVRQMLIESLTLALAGDVAGVALAAVAMRVIATLGAPSIPRLATLTLEPHLLLVSVAVASLCAIGFGMAPAVRAARAQPADALREHGRSGTAGRGAMRGREWLVVAQVALAFVLLVGAGALIASMQRLHQLDLGIRTDHALVFELHLPDARYDSTARRQFYQSFAQRLEAIPGVVAAGGISKLPATGEYNQWGTLARSGPLVGDKDRGRVGAEQRIVSGDYFKAAGIPVLDGRTFDIGDGPDAPDRVVVSQSLARRLYPGARAVGQQVSTVGRQSEIIGVVGDVAINPEGDPDVYLYHSHSQWAGDRNWALAQVVRTTASPESMEPAVRQALAAADPQLVMFKPATLADAVGQGIAQRAFTVRILAAFALVALALAALGLFGVLSYGVRLRSREFGIRMALGAESGAIRRMVIRQGMTMTGIGIVIGLLGAVVASRAMTALVFHGSALDPAALVGGGVFMLAIGAVAAYLPARRATGVDPREVL